MHYYALSFSSFITRTEPLLLTRYIFNIDICSGDDMECEKHIVFVLDNYEFDFLRGNAVVSFRKFA